jgi:Protein of unknown function (DUF1488)
MLLERGEVQNYDSDRMVLEFTMRNEGKIIRCAISSAAMDRLDGGRRDVKADHRLDQFMRLRDRIEERVSIRFFENLQSDRPVVLRSNDF